MRDCYDVRVFLAPPEDVRRRWKVQRDGSRRGYTTDEVLAELDRREPDSAAFIRPQERYADIVVSFLPRDDAVFDAELVLRDGLAHPEFAGGITVSANGAERRVLIPGDLDAERAAEIEEAIWDRLHFAARTCAASAWASTRSAWTCTARSRWRSCSCSSSTTS